MTKHEIGGGQSANHLPGYVQTNVLTPDSRFLVTEIVVTFETTHVLVMLWSLANRTGTGLTLAGQNTHKLHLVSC